MRCQDDQQIQQFLCLSFMIAPSLGVVCLNFTQIGFHIIYEICTFFRSDGTFTVNNVPSGSYIVEVANPTYAFESVRVDITSKGKIRARRLNNLQPSAVHQVTYPLKFKARGKANYFQQREQWRITDFLMNPMVRSSSLILE